MAVTDPTKLLVAVKSFARGNALPLDSNEVHDSYDAAATYAASATAYAGQTIKALVNGVYKTYTLQPSESGYVLDEVGALKAGDLKQYVQIVTSFPTENQEQGVIYISGSVGKVWNGTDWVVVFEGVTKAEIKDINDALDLKAPLASPAFTGSVTIDGKAAATEEYVEGLIANLNSGVPGLVDSTNALPSTYKAGETWRVAEAGTYAGNACEPGDLIIALVSRTEAGTSANSDFMVVQANINGAVTGPASATDGNIVVFDGATGKIIKNSSISIASLETALAELAKLDADTLATYNKTQSTLIEEVNKTAADALASAKEELEGAIGDVDAKFEGYYTSAQVDDKLLPISQNLNTKASSTDLAEAKAELEAKFGDLGTDAEGNAKTVTDYVAGRLGDIGDTNTVASYVSSNIGDLGTHTTVKSYVDAVVQSGGVDSQAAIDAAKAEAINTAKSYTDGLLTVIEF